MTPPAVCLACSRPIPPPELPALTLRVLELLDREGSASASAIARELHRRKADVLASLHELEGSGVVRRVQATAAAGSRRWAAKSSAGTDQEPTEEPEALRDGFTAAGSLVALLAALAASVDSWPKRLAIAVGIGLVLVLAGTLARREALSADL
jgi:hypothetical protein